MNIVAQRVPGHQDIGEFSAWLRQRGIPHRVSEQGDALIIRVANEPHATLVRECYQDWLAGELSPPQQEPTETSQPESPGALHMLAGLPVTSVLIVLSVCGALLVSVDRSFEWVAWLTFTDPRQPAAGLLAGGEAWRLITPIFLHFGALHICFNALWLWELGRRIEYLQGGARLLQITLLVGVLSNSAQAWDTGGIIFGGMSGVIYGLLGYCVVWSRLRPHQTFAINPGVVIFMLAWLVLCYTGFTRLLAGVDTANAAHTSGLIAGAALGAVAALLTRR